MNLFSAAKDKLKDNYFKTVRDEKTVTEANAIAALKADMKAAVDHENPALNTKKQKKENSNFRHDFFNSLMTIVNDNDSKSLAEIVRLIEAKIVEKTSKASTTDMALLNDSHPYKGLKKALDHLKTKFKLVTNAAATTAATAANTAAATIISTAAAIPATPTHTPKQKSEGGLFSRIFGGGDKQRSTTTAVDTLPFSDDGGDFGLGGIDAMPSMADQERAETAAKKAAEEAKKMADLKLRIDEKARQRKLTDERAALQNKEVRKQRANATDPHEVVKFLKDTIAPEIDAFLEIKDRNDRQNRRLGRRLRFLMSTFSATSVEFFKANDNYKLLSKDYLAAYVALGKTEKEQIERMSEVLIVYAKKSAAQYKRPFLQPKTKVEPFLRLLNFAKANGALADDVIVNIRSFIGVLISNLLVLYREVGTNELNDGLYYILNKYLTSLGANEKAEETNLEEIFLANDEMLLADYDLKSKLKDQKLAGDHRKLIKQLAFLFKSEEEVEVEIKGEITVFAERLKRLEALCSELFTSPSAELMSKIDNMLFQANEFLRKVKHYLQRPASKSSPYASSPYSSQAVNELEFFGCKFVQMDGYETFLDVVLRKKFAETGATTAAGDAKKDEKHEAQIGRAIELVSGKHKNLFGLIPQHVARKKHERESSLMGVVGGLLGRSSVTTKDSGAEPKKSPRGVPAKESPRVPAATAAGEESSNVDFLLGDMSEFRMGLDTAEAKAAEERQRKIDAKLLKLREITLEVNPASKLGQSGLKEQLDKLLEAERAEIEAQQKKIGIVSIRKFKEVMSNPVREYPDGTLCGKTVLGIAERFSATAKLATQDSSVMAKAEYALSVQADYLSDFIDRYSAVYQKVKTGLDADDERYLLERYSLRIEINGFIQQFERISSLVNPSIDALAAFEKAQAATATKADSKKADVPKATVSLSPVVPINVDAEIKAAIEKESTLVAAKAEEKAKAVMASAEKNKNALVANADKKVAKHKRAATATSSSTTLSPADVERMSAEEDALGIMVPAGKRAGELIAAAQTEAETLKPVVTARVLAQLSDSFMTVSNMQNIFRKAINFATDVQFAAVHHRKSAAYSVWDEKLITQARELIDFIYRFSGLYQHVKPKPKEASNRGIEEFKLIVFKIFETAVAREFLEKLREGVRQVVEGDLKYFDCFDAEYLYRALNVLFEIERDMRALLAPKLAAEAAKKSPPVSPDAPSAPVKAALSLAITISPPAKQVSKSGAGISMLASLVEEPSPPPPGSDSDAEPKSDDEKADKSKQPNFPTASAAAEYAAKQKLTGGAASKVDDKKSAAALAASKKPKQRQHTSPAVLSATATSLQPAAATVADIPPPPPPPPANNSK